MVLAAVFFLSPNLMKATHIIGGEMLYRCLGNNQYELTLNLYRDCFYGASDAEFDDPASIGVFDNLTNQLLMDLRIPFMGDDTLRGFLADPCFVVPPTVCVHTTVYRDTVTLLPRPGGYHIAYQRCCRNQTINNIINPLNTGATYDIVITEKALTECNNSPVFREWPPIFVCAGSVINYDHSAVDLDGDSIVYKLCTPSTGATRGVPKPQPPNAPPYDTVVWVAPLYNLSNLLGAGDPLRIDVQTGRLTGRPELLGQFVVGVCIEEYRNGELLSKTRRDFQYNIGECGKITSAFAAPEAQCDNLTVNFDNQSQFSNNFEWIFDFPAGNFRSNEREPTFTYPDTGLYTVALIAEPNSVCADTFYQDIYLQNNSLFADFDASIFDCVDSTQIVITDLSVDTVSPIVSWDWEIRLVGAGIVITSTDQHPVFVVPNPDTVNITLNVVSQNGCMQTLIRTIPVDELDPGDGIVDTLRICEGDSIELNPSGNPAYDYIWSPASGLVGGAASVNLFNPTAAPATTTTYSVEISAGNTFCKVTKEVTVVVQPPPVVDFSYELDCDDRTVIFNNLSSTGNTVDYIWIFGDPTNPGAGSNLFNPSYTYPDTGTYNVSLILGSTSVCKDTIVKDVKVEDRILEAAFGFEYLNCEPGGLTIEFNDQSLNSANNTTDYNWFFNPPGVSLSGPNPQFTLSQSTDLEVNLVITTAQGCIDSVRQVLDINMVEDFPNDVQQICANDTTELNPNFNPNYTYEWSPSTGLDDPNSPNPRAVLNVSQDYTVKISAYGADTCEVIWNVSINVPMPIDLQTSGDEITCDSFVTIQASSASTNNIIWYENGVQVGTGNSLTVLVSGIKVYTAVAEDLIGCREEESVTVAGGPVDVIVPDDQTICLGDSMNLSITNLDPNDDLQYAWSPSNFFVPGTEDDPNPVLINPVGRKNITVRVTNQFGCIYEDSFQLVVVDPNAVLAFDYAVQCNGLTVVFENQSVNAFDFVWNFGDPNNPSAISTEDNPTYTYSDTGSYEVILTTAYNLACVDTLRKTIRVSDVVLRADFEADYTDCADSQVEVTFIDRSFSLQNSITSYVWNIDGTIYTVPSPVIIFTTDTTIDVTLYVTDAVGCEDSISRQITIQLLNFTLPDSLIQCNQEDLFLNPQGNPDYTYSWEPANSVDDPTSANPQFTGDETTIFTVVVQNIGADTCEIIKIVKVIVPDPIDLQIPNDTSTCGTPIVLQASGNMPLRYIWTSSATGAVLSNSELATINPVDTDVIIVEGIDIYNCSVRDSFTIVNNQVDIQTSGNIASCEETYTEISAINLDPRDTLTYDWTPAAQILSGQNTANPVVKTDRTGLNVFQVFVENQFGCRDTGSVRLTILPFNPAIEDSLMICPDVITNLNPNPNPNQQYFWSPPAGLLDPQTTANPRAQLTQSTTYTVIITQMVDTLICKDTAMVFVDVNMPLQLQTSPDDTLCEIGLVELFASSSVPGLTYTWSDSPDFDPVLGSDSVLLVSRRGINTYYVMAEDSLGCTEVEEIVLNIVPIEISVDPDTVICKETADRITVTNLNPEQILSYEWSPITNILSGGDTNSPEIILDETTTFTVNITNQFGCEAQEDVTVQVVDLGSLIDVSATPDSILPGGESQLLATLNSNYTYLWSPSGSLDDNTIYNPLATPNETTTYTVEVVDENGCISVREVTVVVFDPICADPYVFLPNAFSPNGDGENDILYLRANYIEEMDLEIYNRWGQKMFQTTDQSIGWDGNFKGEPVSPDVYAFYLRVKCINGEEFFKKGNVTLVR